MKTIKTNTHLLLVDETGVGFTYNKPTYNSNGTIGKAENRNSLAIIAAYPPLEGCYEFETLPIELLKQMALAACDEALKLNSQLGNSKESNTEDNVEKLFYEFDTINKRLGGNPRTHKEYFINGYKQAKSETMFSLEQVKQAIDLAREIKDDKEIFELEGIVGCTEVCMSNASILSIDKIIQSLTKSKEYEFVPEMENLYDEDNGMKVITIPKIINNKIQGTWKLK